MKDSSFAESKKVRGHEKKKCQDQENIACIHQGPNFTTGKTQLKESLFYERSLYTGEKDNYRYAPAYSLY